MKEGEFHRYLGRRLSVDADLRLTKEIQYRKQQAWYLFEKHKKCLTSHDISLRRGLRYFDACITPTILFALSVFLFRRHHLHEINVMQRKMMRKIVGWRVDPNGSWRDAMATMKGRLLRAQR